jgi:putative membrane-bound dehydrogenase-like protein
MPRPPAPQFVAAARRINVYVINVINVKVFWSRSASIVRNVGVERRQRSNQTAHQHDIGSMFVPVGRKKNISLAVRAAWLLITSAGFAVPSAMAQSPVSNAPGVITPPGFSAQWYADDELAHDIYCMTLDSQGRVVVSGAGYVRTLLDHDGDGRAESYETFVEGPASGAQGLMFDGHDLLCVGDGGLLRYRDSNADGRADGFSPELLLKIRTGGEHHAHAIRRGPDGYWYLLAGNDSQVTADYVTAARSPVRDPRAGTLLRFSPAFQECAVVADGFRNAYDFDFNDSGDIFVYDSDGERDVSLPWYRPTRVFQIVPGGHAGWITRSWKRPNDYVDMPPVVAELGRGSPTGVACYRHDRFPQEYHGALLVADWTFGRVAALHLRQDSDGIWHSTVTSLVSGAGQFGFAPTDLEVGLDGCLYVSVGGRGTRGGVLRISCDDTRAVEASTVKDAVLDRCLSTRIPLSAWSQSFRRHAATNLDRRHLENVVRSNDRAPAQRMRAVELVTERFGGLSVETHEALVAAPPSVRARAAWSLGYGTLEDAARARCLLPYFQDDQAAVASAALTAAFYHPAVMQDAQCFDALRRHLLNHSSVVVRQLAARLLAGSDLAAADDLRRMADELSPVARLSLALSEAERSGHIREKALAWSVSVFDAAEDPATRLAALRGILLAIGDVGPRDGRDAVFDGYAPLLELPLSDTPMRGLVSRLAAAYPSGNESLDAELERMLGVLQCDDSAALDKIVSQITEHSPLPSDIHRLIVIARLTAPRTSQHRAAIAVRLADLEDKLERQHRRQDQNWSPRLQELFQALVQRDPQFPETLVAAAGFGHPGHGMFLKVIPETLRTTAIDRLLDRTPAVWTPELLSALGASPETRHRDRLREAAQDPATRDMALANLAGRLDADDRSLYFRGLTSHSFDTLSACLSAIEKLPAAEGGGELSALVVALSRLQGDRVAYETRERVARLLQISTSQTHGFQFGRQGHHPQSDAVAAWMAWLQSTYPEDAGIALGATLDTQALDDQLRQVDWSRGDAVRGGALFRQKSCQQCHGGRQALGPDLAGVAQRFSTRDLFTAIVFPSLTVSPRYQTVILETHDGQVFQGAVTYESVDGITLTTGANRTIRVEAADIAQRSTSAASLMPSGLLDQLQPDDYADLLAYLKTLDNR